jgi:PAS domain S-box-containing protein
MNEVADPHRRDPIQSAETLLAKGPRTAFQIATALLDSMTEGVSLATEDGTIVYANPAEERIFGYTPGELNGLHVSVQNAYPPEDNERIIRSVIQDLKDHGSWEGEWLNRRKDGSVFHTKARISTVEIDGRPYWLCVQDDVTEHKAATEALRKSEGLKGAILSASLDSIVTIDRDSRIVEWNAAAERTFGYSREVATGQDMTELIVPAEAREAHRAGMLRYLETGIGPVLNKRIEVEGLRCDGSRFPIELAISPIDIGGAALFTAFIRDISARKRSELVLLESEQRLRATYENASAGIGEVDATGRFLRVNERLCLITGYPREELLGRTIFEITHPEDREHDREYFRRQVEGRLDAYRLEKRYLHKSGRAIWIDVSASVVRESSGAFSYGIRVVDDITERKNAEIHQRLLVNELNHRVKNSLAVVQAIISQSLKAADSPKALSQALEARIVALANAHDVLTKSNWEAADLTEIIRSALRPHDRDPTPFKIVGPALRIKPKPALSLSLAIHELATNAAKYGALSTPNGRIDLTWHITDGHERSFHMQWKESGGPPVAQPTQKGFGSNLLERALAADLGGRIAMSYFASGLVCMIDVPTEEIAER